VNQVKLNNKIMAKKIKKEELKSIQDKVNAINNAQMQVGGLEVQKTLAIEKLRAFQQELNVVQTTLEDKYGKVSVNITDGTIKEIEDGPLN
jgi:allophanate hydrolase subunit 1